MWRSSDITKSNQCNKRSAPCVLTHLPVRGSLAAHSYCRNPLTSIILLTFFLLRRLFHCCLCFAPPDWACSSPSERPSRGAGGSAWPSVASVERKRQDGSKVKINHPKGTNTKEQRYLEFITGGLSFLMLVWRTTLLLVLLLLLVPLPLLLQMFSRLAGQNLDTLWFPPGALSCLGTGSSQDEDRGHSIILTGETPYHCSTKPAEYQYLHFNTC